MLKRKLLVNIAVLVLTVLFVGIIVIFMLNRVNTARRQSELAGEIIITAFERTALRTDYLRTGNERARAQWFAKSRQIEELLSSASTTFTDPHDKKLLDDIIQNHEAVVKLFSAIVANREKAGGDRSTELADETESRLIRLLDMRVYDKAFYARELRDAAGKRLSAEMTHASWSILGLLVLVTVVAGFNSWSMLRIIMKRIGSLSRGAAMIGEGDLDYRLEDRGEDEFTDLVSAFNSMSEKLRRSYVALENEITERKNVEDALRINEERFRRLVEVSSQIVWVTDSSGEAVEDSPSWRAFTGRTYEQWAGRNWLNVVHPDDRKGLSEAWGTAVATGGPYRVEFRMLHHTGEYRHMSVQAAPVLHADGTVREWIGMNVDITDRKRAEEERERLLAEVQRSNRELEQFAYVASHDLQEPLRMVASFMQLFEKRYGGNLDEKGMTYIGYAVDGAKRMQKLIEGLLAYSRIGTGGGEFRLVRMDAVFQSVVTNLTVAIRDSGATVTNAGLPNIFGDELQLTQLLQNLIGNAIKFRKPDTLPTVHVSTERVGSEWVFAISDDGIGIEPEYSDRIFLIFQRLHTREEYPGTGIGLALCKRIVERHHGRMWVESRTGEGSTFFFTIPVLRREPEQGE
ncbi:ATP-binding protein [Geobacter sp. DSM 9736]|uniref:ATP-binding protein n=1 Tax=Geobacter sp. DSM 9736 TaxID=1277350 RepID=UPI000B4FE21F|nr:ATP-binding protein [Geobacter sp. DSM 9736]SNB46220.1 PAS domain S-box-containing protein [Geobacter sp. DSM 9736]